MRCRRAAKFSRHVFACWRLRQHMGASARLVRDSAAADRVIASRFVAARAITTQGLRASIQVGEWPVPIF